VYSGKDWKLLLSHKSTNNLSSVDGAGDIDGDGYDDIIVGSAGGDFATVVSGHDGSTLLSFDSGGKLINFGVSVAGVGDVDGDGHGDMLIGAVTDDTALLPDCGSVRVVSGEDGSVLFTLFGEAAGDSFGTAVDGADLNGDGREDLIVGAIYHGTNGKNAGRVYVFASPAPSAGISIDGGAAVTAYSSVTLSVIWSAGEAAVKEMRLRNAGDSWGGWVEPDASVEWTLRSGEGLKKVEAQVRDEAGLTSRVMSDTIILDQSPPTGTIRLENGAAWTNRERIDVHLDFEDRYTEVAEVRLRNEGGAWTPWQKADSPVPFDLSAGVGLKTVEAQCRDPVGNVSDVAADSIGVDRIPPTGSASIDDGAAFTGTTFVTLRITASDEGGSGLSAFRVKQATSAVWETDWLPMAETMPWEIRSKEGPQGVDVQVRDGAGNESVTARDQISLDRTAPVLDGLVVNGGRPYVLPLESLELVVEAHDSEIGSGVAAFRYTMDGGTTYSEWFPLSPANRVTVERPEAAGPLAVRVMLMDAVGNRSKLWPAMETHLVEAEPPWLGSGGSYGGRLADRQDIDAVAFDMVRKDLLSIKVKASATADRKAPFPLVMDLTRPTGEWLVTGIGLRGLAGFVAPETGRYILVLREVGEGAETGDYAVSVAVKHSVANAKWKGSAESGEVLFEAVHGSSFKAALKGPGLDPASIVVEGPDGPVAIMFTGKVGSAKVSGLLSSGTGTYRVRFVAAGTVSMAWSAKLPKGGALLE
jgi:hypothetical protein